jgi:hypothetical protein
MSKVFIGKRYDIRPINFIGNFNALINIIFYRSYKKLGSDIAL